MPIVTLAEACFASGMVSARITECFEITGRGVVVVVDSETDLPTGHCLKATIRQPDGTTQEYAARKEWLLRSTTPPIENEAFLLVNALSTKLTIGDSITLQIYEA